MLERLEYDRPCQDRSSKPRPLEYARVQHSPGPAVPECTGSLDRKPGWSLPKFRNSFILPYHPLYPCRNTPRRISFLQSEREIELFLIVAVSGSVAPRDCFSSRKGKREGNTCPPSPSHHPMPGKLQPPPKGDNEIAPRIQPSR